MDSTDSSIDHCHDGEMAFAEQVDARGLRCPMPLLKAKQALNRVPAGSLVQVLATDAGAARDFPAFTTLSGHTLLRHIEAGNGEFEFVIRKREESSP